MKLAKYLDQEANHQTNNYVRILCGKTSIKLEKKEEEEMFNKD